MFEQNWKDIDNAKWYATINREVDMNACPFYKLKGEDYSIFNYGNESVTEEERTYQFTITSEPQSVYGETILEGKEGETRDITAKHVGGYTFRHWEYKKDRLEKPKITLLFLGDDQVKAVYEKN